LKEKALNEKLKSLIIQASEKAYLLVTI